MQAVAALGRKHTTLGNKFARNPSVSFKESSFIYRKRCPCRVNSAPNPISDGISNDLSILKNKLKISDLTHEEIADLELDELDAAQEQVLAWMLFKSAEEQQQDLDELIDYDEFDEEEYEGLFEEMEQLVAGSLAAAQNMKVGDKIYGRIYAIHDDGAYVELPDIKGYGFVPVFQCSTAKLKTVRYAHA